MFAAGMQAEACWNGAQRAASKCSGKSRSKKRREIFDGVLSFFNLAFEPVPMGVLTN